MQHARTLNKSTENEKSLSQSERATNKRWPPRFHDFDAIDAVAPMPQAPFNITSSPMSGACDVSKHTLLAKAARARACAVPAEANDVIRGGSGAAESRSTKSWVDSDA
jgi:hypothetical protein